MGWGGWGGYWGGGGFTHLERAEVGPLARVCEGVTLELGRVEETLAAPLHLERERERERASSKWQLDRWHQSTSAEKARSLSIRLFIGVSTGEGHNSGV